MSLCIDEIKFYEPIVLTNAKSDMSIVNEWTFGLISATLWFGDEEIVNLTNDTDFGLASYF